MLKTNQTHATSSWLKLSASAVALLTVVGAGAAYAQAASEQIETVTVTGFRASLEKALDMKRQALDASDSIMAEDIAKFPDMNVSESLQRIPGVAITRESGEGREITVRGLGAQFTRVRINGIEAMATVGSQDVSTSGGGTNRGRSFDFSVFASDLFSQLTVHKSSSASLEEGSLGATVDLHTGHPFDHPGFVFSASGQLGYQEVAGSSNPRIAALVSNTFLGGRLGVLVSAAYSSNNTLEQGTSTVRWMSNLSNSSATSTSNNFSSVDGTTCPASGTQPATCTEANSAFRPRFPRYDIVTTHSKRLGLTGSVQWQPDEDTLFTLDALFADFAQIRNEYYLEANSFSVSGYGSTTTYTDTSDSATHYVTSLGTRSMNVLSYTLGGATGLDGSLNSTNSITKLTASNVGLRNEARLDHLDTRFMQVTLDGTHSFSEAFKVHALAGWTESHHRNPVQTTLAADLGCTGTGSGTATAKLTATSCTGGAGTSTDPYVYDYTKGDMPLLSTGNVDPTSTSGWFLSNIRERQEYAYNSFRSAAGDFEYALMSELKLSGGVDFRNFGFRTLELRRSTGVSGATSEVTTISNANRSVALSTYSKNVKLKGIDVPSGSNTSWFVLDVDKAIDTLGLNDKSTYPVTFDPGYGNTGTVRENDYSGWVQSSWDTSVYGMSLRGDVGVRYILTNMISSGYSLSSYVVNKVTTSTLVESTGENVYHDVLPSLNAVLEPWEDFLVRFNASYAMSRPGLTSMLPSGTVSVSGSNWTVKEGNPKLEPTRSKNLDLSFEWYFEKGSLISIAGFWKHLDTFIITQQSSGTAANNPFGLATAAFVAACGGSGDDWSTVTSVCPKGESTTWAYSVSRNVRGAPLYGTEINLQQQLSFLPHPFDNFGVLGNFTYVQAQQRYTDTNGNFLMNADLTNLSRISFNGTVYYDDTVFQARVTAAFRSHYLIDASIVSNYNNYGIYSKSTLNLDASASYKFDENFLVTFDALNLTNQASNIYADKTAQRSYQYHETGREVYLGVKYTY